MQWGDLITLEYGKPIKDKESANGPIPVYGTNGQIGTSHLKPLCEHPSRNQFISPNARPVKRLRSCGKKS